MADLFEVEIMGDEEFRQTLLALAKSLPNEKVEPVLLDGAKVIADDAKRRSPLGKTGKLKKGIKAKYLRQIGAYPKSAAAVSNSPEDHLIEYGTAPRRQRTTGRFTGAGPAHPFFRPAVDANKGRIQEEIITKLGSMIDGAMK